MRSGKRVFWTSFCVSLAVFLISFAVLGTVFFYQAAEKLEEDNIQTGVTGSSVTNVLVCLRGGERALPDSISLVGFDYEKGQVAYTNLPLYWQVDFGNRTDSLLQCYAYNGMGELIRTLEDRLGIEIDHYADMTYDTLGDFISSFGTVEFTVMENIYQYSESGLLQFRLLYGNQALRGEQIAGYLRFTALEGDQKVTLRLDLAGAFWRTVMAPGAGDAFMAAYNSNVDAMSTSISTVAMQRLCRTIDTIALAEEITVVTPQFFTDGTDYSEERDGAQITTYFK